MIGSAPQTPHGFGDEGYVLALAGSKHLLSCNDDGGIDLVDIVDNVQDWAMDQLGRGWPELVDRDGVFVGLLQPERDDHGDIVWAAGNHRVAIGQLATVSSWGI